MQALYGLKQAEKSDFHLSVDYISEFFAPDLNSMEPRPPQELRDNKNLATELFRKSFTEDKPDLFQHPDEIRKAVNEAIVLYENRIRKDQKHYKKVMLGEIDKIYENYILSLLFLVDLFDYSSDYETEEKGKYLKQSDFPQCGNFIRNTLYQKLKKDEDLEISRVKRNLYWERELVKRTFRSILKADDEFKAYLLYDNPDFEEDRKILVYTAKNCIFKNESLQAFFEERDFNWVENQSIVKSLVVKTLKSAEADTKKILIDISGNWEEDRQFFEDLYQETIERDKELDSYMEGKAKNWEMERIAMTDNIILKMAMAEMITCPAIPVKVSINEYIELSKLYSTPKSKQFVNGMLDSLSQELIAKGIIRKSGRGLIDNK